MAILDAILGSESERYVKKAKGVIHKIQEHKAVLADISDDDLREKTALFKQRLQEGVLLDDLLPEVFAVACEAAKRTTGMDPFEVQMIGGKAIYEGSIAEMRTGEGKTLVAVLPAYLNALSGNSVHIVTVNDYLARRDAVWMGQAFAFLGLTVGVINGQEGSYQYDVGHQAEDQTRDDEGSYKVVYEFLREVPRKEVYQCDIVYGTNNEFVFDYLRDNIAYSPDDIRHRGFHFAIIDEVDSILIDEARSPLIISAPSNIPASHYMQFTKFANTLKEDEDYTIDEKKRAVALTASGIAKFEQSLKVENVYVEGRTTNATLSAQRTKSKIAL